MYVFIVSLEIMLAVSGMCKIHVKQINTEVDLNNISSTACEGYWNLFVTPTGTEFTVGTTSTGLYVCSTNESIEFFLIASEYMKFDFDPRPTRPNQTVSITLAAAIWNIPEFKIHTRLQMFNSSFHGYGEMEQDVPISFHANLRNSFLLVRPQTVFYTWDITLKYKGISEDWYDVEKHDFRVNVIPTRVGVDKQNVRINDIVTCKADNFDPQESSFIWTCADSTNWEADGAMLKITNDENYDCTCTVSTRSSDGPIVNNTWRGTLRHKGTTSNGVYLLKMQSGDITVNIDNLLGRCQGGWTSGGAQVVELQFPQETRNLFECQTNTTMNRYIMRAVKFLDFTYSPSLALLNSNISISCLVHLLGMSNPVQATLKLFNATNHTFDSASADIPGFDDSFDKKVMRVVLRIVKNQTLFCSLELLLRHGQQRVYRETKKLKIEVYVPARQTRVDREEVSLYDSVTCMAKSHPPILEFEWRCNDDDGWFADGPVLTMLKYGEYRCSCKARNYINNTFYEDTWSGMIRSGIGWNGPKIDIKIAMLLLATFGY